jgi:hypothetical protein
MSTNVNPDGHGANFLPPDLRDAFIWSAEVATSAWAAAYSIAGAGLPEFDAQMTRRHLTILARAHDRAREAILKVAPELLDTRKNRGPARFGHIEGATAHEAALAFSGIIDSRIMLAVTKATADILRDAGPAVQQDLQAFFANRWATWDLTFLARHFESWRQHFDHTGIPSSPAEMIGDMKIEAAAAARARLAAPPQVVRATAGANRPRKEPSNDALTVYRYWLVTGRKQTDLEADPQLAEQLGRYVNQGTISRWLMQVGQWIEAGNVLPSLPSNAHAKPVPIDPERIDLGKRQDGRTERQKGRRNSDGD